MIFRIFLNTVSKMLQINIWVWYPHLKTDEEKTHISSKVWKLVHFSPPSNKNLYSRRGASQPAKTFSLPPNFLYTSSFNRPINASTFTTTKKDDAMFLFSSFVWLQGWHNVFVLVLCLTTRMTQCFCSRPLSDYKDDAMFLFSSFVWLQGWHNVFVLVLCLTTRMTTD